MEESTQRKRKGTDEIRRTPGVVGSHLSFEDHTRRKKKCKEEEEGEEEALPEEEKRPPQPLHGVVTAPPFSRRLLSSGSPTRGIKRKLGCIDSTTRICGRKRRIERDYVLGRPIGKGKFGSVRSCTSRLTREEFACKTLMRNGSEPVHREVEIMQHLSGHPGVVTLRAVYEDRESFHLVMEMCPGGRLLDQMIKEGRYTERRAASIIRELVLVMKYCHDMGVVHRDIKPENVLLTASGKMKLADFGLATRITSGQSLSGIVGSPAYVAPEVLTGHYSEKVDVWAAGVLLHALLVGVLPFQGNSLEAVFEAIKSVKLDFSTEIWGSISKLARDLIGRMLTRDVSKRMTADEILSHPWIIFYSESPAKALPVKSTGQEAAARVVLQRKRADNGCFTIDFDELCSLESSSQRSYDDNESDDTGLVDVLAAAISRVRISEPKRTRLCVPAGPIQQSCSSNMKTKLCTAF
ncbi:Serine/threonine-protein kinase PEPKR2 [Acorus calamus]|uniref:Serine/threonine-protein kinase PEPKR2 n=1 Tax=Acorus calamus TaxID=4465 RepID=A0AAV9EMQ1_ACOCL|nr:Serine/threonine-protein kinase PEPKR2 [Acorus calamus]